MSAFTEPTPVVPTPVTEETTTFLDQLVGEGKKFKTVEDLAKGKAEADTLIEEMKAKAEDYKEQDYAKQLLEKMESKTTVPPVQTPEPNKGPNDVTPPQVAPEDIESLVNKTLLAREHQSKLEANIASVNVVLDKEYGTEAEAKVLEVASNLGMSKDNLQKLAAESPDAFLQLMGKKREASPTIPSSEVNTSNLNPNQRDFAYYNKLRKESPKSFSSPSIQRQMMEDKAKLGDKFFT
tara:strand:+ start:12174 stop:12884 length:711 start_codon:yes stop_codon:yes gene_type:complete